jgi:hypothetical protein
MAVRYRDRRAGWPGRVVEDAGMDERAERSPDADPEAVSPGQIVIAARSWERLLVASAWTLVIVVGAMALASLAARGGPFLYALLPALALLLLVPRLCIRVARQRLVASRDGMTVYGAWRTQSFQEVRPVAWDLRETTYCPWVTLQSPGHQPRKVWLWQLALPLQASGRAVRIRMRQRLRLVVALGLEGLHHQDAR